MDGCGSGRLMIRGNLRDSGAASTFYRLETGVGQ